jgi:hypothetical protein
VRTLHGKATALAPGATVAIVPAIAGGAPLADRRTGPKTLCSQPLTALSILA